MCKNSRQPIDDHFVEVTEMVPWESGAERQLRSKYLSRYACYLIIQSADLRKPVVALMYSYFSLQTRCQELKDDRRLQLRQKIKEHSKRRALLLQQNRLERFSQ